MTEAKYKTGDIHPEHNQLAFVTYDEQGREKWTSVYGDLTAPHRFAAESVSKELGRKCSLLRNRYNELATRADLHR